MADENELRKLIKKQIGSRGDMEVFRSSSGMRVVVMTLEVVSKRIMCVVFTSRSKIQEVKNDGS